MRNFIIDKRLYMHVINAGIKFTGYGCILFLADYLIPGLFYSLSSLLFTNLVLTIVGVIGDAMILPNLGNLKSLSIGEFGMAAILWLSPRLWPNSQMTITWAVVLTLFILPLEFALHSWMLRTLFHNNTQYNQI